MDWIDLTQLEQLELLQERSNELTIAIFKHSTRCGVSSMVLKGLNRELAGMNTAGIEFYFLDLIKYRDISNTIARVWSVNHQSPQLIVLKNGEVINHASHYMISAELLQQSDQLS